MKSSSLTISKNVEEIFGVVAVEKCFVQRFRGCLDLSNVRRLGIYGCVGYWSIDTVDTLLV